MKKIDVLNAVLDFCKEILLSNETLNDQIFEYYTAEQIGEMIAEYIMEVDQ